MGAIQKDGTLGALEFCTVQANPPLILHSINLELMRELNEDKINAKYLEESQKLERAGAEAIVICANTPHMAYEHCSLKSVSQFSISPMPGGRKHNGWD